jgi:hypothetical protein
MSYRAGVYFSLRSEANTGATDGLRITYLRTIGGRNTMKKLAFVIGLIFLLALAVPAMAGGNGALVHKNGFCPIYTGEYGTIFPGDPPFGLLFTEDSRFIMNDNVIKLICHGQITENFPPEAVRYGSSMGDFAYVGVDGWQVVITPRGEATLTAWKRIVVHE